MRAKVILFCAPLLGLLCSAAEGRAGMITWTANWSQSTDVIGANGGALVGRRDLRLTALSESRPGP